MECWGSQCIPESGRSADVASAYLREKKWMECWGSQCIPDSGGSAGVASAYLRVDGVEGVLG